MRDSTAVILFSGGADSGLAAALALEKHKGIILLTVRNGYELFIHRSHVVANRLREKYGSDSVSHVISDSRHTLNLILKDRFALKQYLKNPLLLCFAERIAIYIQTVIFCLENHFIYIYDGSNYYQGQMALPQAPEILTNIKEFFLNYGLSYQSPIYRDTELSENRLFEKGFIRKNELYQTKRLFFKEDDILPVDIISGIWYKLRNKLHPIFLIETGLQLWGRLTGFKGLADISKHKNMSEVRLYLSEKLEVGKKYIQDYLIKKATISPK